MEIGAGTGSLTLQLVPRQRYWASDINPLYLTYLKNLGVNRPYMRVGYTDGEKAIPSPGHRNLTPSLAPVGPAESPSLPPPVDRSRRYKRILLILFLCTLPLANPIVHGDGVGYYAYVRAPLIQHNLRFEEDWRHANLNFSQSRAMPNGKLLPSQYTETGYVSNQFTVGPALLWAAFLVAAHGFVLLSDARGAHIPADGFSFPYLLTMALGTAFYGFLGLLLSYSLARKYVAVHWAFLATTWNLGRQLAPRVHVFQSSVVPRALRLCRRSFSLVLGSHVGVAHALRVDPSRFRSGPDD